MNLFWKRIAKTADYEQDMANRHELYNAFVKTEASDLLKEYRELAEIDFNQAKKQFDKQSEYFESPIYEKELRFKKIGQDSDIKNYLKHEKSDIFDFVKNYTQVFEEDFLNNKLDYKQWVNAYRWSQQQIKGNYSSPNEYQAYTEGENTEVTDGQLHIITKRKDTEGRVWSADKGFVTKPFKYTSDLIAGESHLMTSGCVLVKFKVDGASRPLHHFIRAYDDKNQRCITLFESTSPRRFNVGRTIRDKKEGNLHSNIRGLKLSEFHILELEWNSEIVSWRINGHLIHQDTKMSDMKDMHLAIGSTLAGAKGKEGKIIVDYIRIFKKRD